MEEELKKGPIDATEEFHELRLKEEERRHGHWDPSSPGGPGQNVATSTRGSIAPPLPVLPSIAEPGSPTPQTERARTGELLRIGQASRSARSSGYASG
ncbi:hypothetical protein AcW2_005605 [Taiwanofungus camphoratus]|nr:hypothetical protein AcW2_005605 [Antrodia cinnamomea]